MAWTSIDDITGSWIGDDVPTNTDTLSRWIERAERLVRREFPTLEDRLNAGREPDLIETVKDVVCAMVTRVFRNPEGIRQRQETDGSFTGSVTFGGDSPGMLVLLDSERDALRDPGSSRTGQAFSIHMGTNLVSGHLPWCDHTWNPTLCSCGAAIAGHPIYEGGEHA